MFKKLNEKLEKLYFSKYSSALNQELNEIDDFFMIITFAELYGIENPYALYTLDLTPSLMQKYHEWHTKLGIKTSFFENMPCTCC